ncbi:hypothetical protein V0U79_03300 [Hyphobacterium sp. HN65]|uniref:DUF5667 domain-containing protein n=1 Tax=Hyphobacterium lacteum TaxID=3116575 RepID=A0ABU7LN94_9PROT|nr:hypothetical protein [Hyphobacterium sp. HN65]MEE2525379.1 hypothetical protein [Hyphobacterium sp. HN65]
MKKLLALTTASAALIGAGCSTAAMAAQQDAVADRHENVQVFVTRHSGDSQSVVIRGVDVEINGEDIVISGDDVRTTPDGRVIISSDNADIMAWTGEGDFEIEFSGADHELRFAEIEAELEAELGRLEDMHVIVDEIHVEGLEEAFANIERELGELEGRRFVVVNGERRDLTDEEREQIRRELEEARNDIRESMADVEREMSEGREERQEALRVMRVELANAREEMRRAEHEARHVRVELARDHGRHSEIARQVREAGASEVRIESENGEHRVWVDGEELEGDARTEWLNRLEVERLEGGEGRRHMVIELDDEE